MLEVLPVLTPRERRTFLTFPWRIYKGDPLWVPPILAERAKAIDPRRGGFFKNGYADLLIAWRDGQPVGTICCAEDLTATKFKGYGECMIGFFECIEDYAVAEALLARAEAWAREHDLLGLYGPYNLNYDDSRGLLIAGRDRPPVLWCGHTPPYYADYFDRFGMTRRADDGLAYAVDLDLENHKLQRLMRLAEKIRARRPDILVRGANLKDVDREIDRVWDLTNRSLAHLDGFTPWSREMVEEMLKPMASVVDPELILFAEVDGRPAGFFPGVDNMNEVLIHVNGLRYPWDYLKLAWYMRRKPKCLAIKSVLVPPEYWDTGVGVLLFDEMVCRAVARGYAWADLSITGEENPDTRPLALHLGALEYKRYRIYQKKLAHM